MTGARWMPPHRGRGAHNSGKEPPQPNSSSPSPSTSSSAHTAGLVMLSGDGLRMSNAGPAVYWRYVGVEAGGGGAGGGGAASIVKHAGRDTGGGGWGRFREPHPAPTEALTRQEEDKVYLVIKMQSLP